MTRIVAAAAFVIAFNAIAISVLLHLPAALGLVWGLAIGGAFLWWHVRPGERSLKRQALVRIRPPRSSYRWTLLAVSSTLLLAFGMSGVIGYIGPSDEPEYPEIYQRIIDYQGSLSGWLAVIIIIALVVPIVEEFCFRGHIQHTLERRYGAKWAIAVSAALFTVAHVGLPHWSIFLIPLTLGLAMGTVVYLSGSIWIAVLIHGLWNFSMAAADVVLGEVAPRVEPPGPGTLLASTLVLLGLGVGGWVALLRGGKRGARAGSEPGVRSPGRPGGIGG